MRMKLAWLLLLPLGISTGCDGDDFDPDTDIPGDDDDDGTPGDDDDDDGGVPDQARVRVVHLGTSLGDLDLQVERVPEAGLPDDQDEDEVDPTEGRDLDDRAEDDVIEIDGLAYSDATQFLSVRAGTRDLFVYPSGSNDEVVNLNLELQANRDYTLILWGDGTTELQTLLVLEDESGLADDDIRLSMSHVAVGVGDIDVLDISDVAPMLLADDLAIGTNEAADVDDDVSAVGLDLDDDLLPDLEFDLPGDLGSDDLVHLIASTDAQGDFVLVVYPDSRTERLDPRVAVSDFGLLRFLNLDPTSRDYDVWVGDCPMPSVTDSRFLSDTDYIPIRPGTHTFRIIPRGMDDSILEFQLDISGDRLHSAAWYLAGQVLDAISMFDDDDTGLKQGDFRIQFANLIDGVPVLDILRIQPGPNPVVLDDAEFDGVASFDLDADKDHTLGLDVDLDGKVDLVFDLPDVAKKGEIHNLYAIDFDPDDLPKGHGGDDDYAAYGGKHDEPEVVLLVMHTPDGKVIPIETEVVDDPHHDPYPYMDDDDDVM